MKKHIECQCAWHRARRTERNADTLVTQNQALYDRLNLAEHLLRQAYAFVYPEHPVSREIRHYFGAVDEPRS